jgi:poly-gamma-glutamate synthesis protein (capsule biosynthesis protein)
MVFVGDIAVPRETRASLPSTVSYFGISSVIANLEGAILDGAVEPQGTSLYNDQAVIEYLRENNFRLLSLANNHIVDIDDSPRVTIRLLHEHGILTCGAGDSLEEASRPVLLEEREEGVVFIGFGWETIGCRIASVDRAGVNPFALDSVIDGIKRAKESFPGKAIVLLMHWNYELEMYPQPMHRQIAHLAIDQGASAVVGCHSHCVQGIELYKGCPIVYGLGNWFLPEGTIFGRNLRFPDFALRQLAFEWIPSTREMKCHWFSYNRRTQSLDFEQSESLQDSRYVAMLTPFSGMDHQKYVKWFKLHRRKKLLLPIYKDCRSHRINRLKDLWVKGRHLLISMALAANWKAELR